VDGSCNDNSSVSYSCTHGTAPTQGVSGVCDCDTDYEIGTGGALDGFCVDKANKICKEDDGEVSVANFWDGTNTGLGCVDGTAASCTATTNGVCDCGSDATWFSKNDYLTDGPNTCVNDPADFDDEVFSAEDNSKIISNGEPSSGTAGDKYCSVAVGKYCTTVEVCASPNCGL